MTVQTDAVIAGYKAARALAGVSATYTRGANEVRIKVVQGMTQLSAEQGDGTIIITNSHDFLILASDLVINGSTVLPLRGDTITVSGTVYTVLTYGSDPQYRWMDQERKILRVHTRNT